MMKDLSRRQKQFLNQFLDMYEELVKPIHYGALAKRLDISKVTAYEMLRLLETRGLVQAEYYLPSGVRGPGRAEVRFKPTNEAKQLYQQLKGNYLEIRAWEEEKQNIIKGLLKGKAVGYETLLNDLLIRIPEQHSPLIFITEMITLIILAIMTINKTTEKKGLIERLSRIGFPGELGLLALVGFGAALSLVEDVNISISTFLMNQIVKYQDLLSHLNEENYERMMDFTQNIVKIMAD